MSVSLLPWFQKEQSSSERRTGPQSVHAHVDSAAAFLCEPGPLAQEDFLCLDGQGHPHLCLEPWAGRNSPTKNPSPKYLKDMTVFAKCSHIPHPMWPTRQPWRVCRASCIVPIYRQGQRGHSLCACSGLDMPRDLHK